MHKECTDVVDRRLVLYLMLELVRCKEPFSIASLHTDRYSAPDVRLTGAIGRAMSRRDLYLMACEVFGSWGEALKACHLLLGRAAYDEFRPRRKQWMGRWTRRIIVSVLKAFHNKRISLNAGSIGRETSDAASAIVHWTSGRRAQGRRIYSVGRRSSGSWDTMLKSSGFLPSSVRLRAASCLADREHLIDIIQVLHANGYMLNLSSMMRESKNIQIFLEAKFDRAMSGISVVNMSKKLFGSWHRALWAAGLNPSEVCLRSPVATWTSEIVPVQIPQSPEAVLESRRALKMFTEVSEKIPAEHQDLADRVFDAVLQIHHYKHQNELIRHVTNRLGDVAEETVVDLFAQLKRSLSERVAGDFENGLTYVE